MTEILKNIIMQCGIPNGITLDLWNRFRNEFFQTCSSTCFSKSVTLQGEQIYEKENKRNGKLRRNKIEK